jgi:hypothetical protein
MIEAEAENLGNAGMGGGGEKLGSWGVLSSNLAVWRSNILRGPIATRSLLVMEVWGNSPNYIQFLLCGSENSTVLIR